MAGRPCSVCQHPERNTIDRLLRNSTSVADIANSTAFRELSVHALYRHAKSHLPELSAAPVTLSDETASADLVLRLTEALDDASRLRRRAVNAGNVAGAGRALAAERGIIRDLIETLGIDSIETAQNLAHFRDLAGAVSAVVGAEPRIGHLIATELRAMRSRDLADALVAHADSSAKELSRNEES